MSTAPHATSTIHDAASPGRRGGGGQFTMNVLNGLAVGTVVCLIPGAMLSELVKALLPHAAWLQVVLNATLVSNAVMGAVVGFLVGLNFRFTPIQCGALGLATQFAAGAVLVKDGTMVLKGTGDVITMGVTAAIGAAVILLLGNRMRAYSILVFPAVVLAIAGVAGREILPWSLKVTSAIGRGVASLLGLQPVVMAVLLAVIFAALIVSPITSVGIALAIGLAGLGSGAANLGICACGFGFAVMGWGVNSHGTSLAHFIGSPKISMANVVRRPIILLPILCNAAVCGALASLLHITGTPMSAGFGFSGLVGPLAYLGQAGWGGLALVKCLLGFLVAPLGLAFAFKALFTRIWPVVHVEDYFLDMH